MVRDAIRFSVIVLCVLIISKCSEVKCSVVWCGTGLEG